jgi:hypothetical protein
MTASMSPEGVVEVALDDLVRARSRASECSFLERE